MKMALFLALVLAGCATAEEREARRAAEDDARCLSLGFHSQTDPYRQCRLQLHIARQQEEAIFGAALISAYD